MKLDSHQHFWHYNPNEHIWMNDQMEVLKRDYEPKDLQSLLKTTGFDGTIAVQARQMLEETQWLLDLSDQYDLIKGVVGWVDLCSEEIDAQLERFAKHDKLKGVRHVVQEEPDDNFILGDNFLRGISKLKAHDLTYDLLVFPRQLPASIKIVEQFPELPFVVDHIAKPDIKNNVVSGWEEDIRTLAKFPNVMCKLSGMVTEADWQSWTPSEFQVYMDIIMESFGPKRIMIGSDWPVCTLCGSYEEVMQIVTDYISQFSPEIQNDILGENCARFYRVS